MAFWIKEKEIKSDLYYRVTATGDSSFSYEKNGRTKSKAKSLNLVPGDWVTISSTKNLEFKERAFLNWMHIFYIKKRSIFNMLIQIALLLTYVFAYVFAFFELNEAEAGLSFGIEISSIIKDLLLFAPIVLLTLKLIKTSIKAIALSGPNRALKKKLSDIESIVIKDKRKNKRKISFNNSMEMVEDEYGTYYYGDAEKVNSNIYKFGLLIFNKEKEPLYNVEYYTVQVDFKQLEGVLIPKSRKLEHSNVHLNHYKIQKETTKTNKENK